MQPPSQGCSDVTSGPGTAPTWGGRRVWVGPGHLGLVHSLRGLIFTLSSRGPMACGPQDPHKCGCKAPLATWSPGGSSFLDRIAMWAALFFGTWKEASTFWGSTPEPASLTSSSPIPNSRCVGSRKPLCQLPQLSTRPTVSPSASPSPEHRLHECHLQHGASSPSPSLCAHT